MGGQLGSVVRTAQHPQRRLGLGRWISVNAMPRVTRRQFTPLHPGVQLHDLLRKTFGRVTVRVEHLRRAAIAAGRTAYTQVDAPGRQRVQHAKLLGHLVRCVMRQHHASAADADALRARCDRRHQDFGGRAHDARVAVVLADPETVVAPGFGLLRQRQRVADGFVVPATGGGHRLVQDRQTQTHALSLPVRPSRLPAGHAT